MATHDEIVIDMIREDIREIKEDVKELLALKWRIVGAVSVLSILVTVFTEIIIQYAQYH